MADYLTVTELTQYINQKFVRDPYLERIYLTGEISNSKRNHPNGNQYFTLKDSGAQISAVMFKQAYQKANFSLREGDKVLVVGRISLYKPYGKYQIVVEHIAPDGVGQLYRQYEETRERLKKEGLFDLPKKTIPKFPKKIAILTSSSGAVVHDIMKNIKQRYPIVQMVLFPTVVQGKGSVDSIVTNLAKANVSNQFDSLIIGRGGGSFEDLFSFNEEAVVRAIVASKIPVISSVGHETDTTLSDFVSDARASTPTEAAVLATPILKDTLADFERYLLMLEQTMTNTLKRKSEQFHHLSDTYIFRQPDRLYNEASQRLDLVYNRLLNQLGEGNSQQEQVLNMLMLRLESLSPAQFIQQQKDFAYQEHKHLILTLFHSLASTENQLNQLLYNLDLLSPLKILSRGYSLTKKDDKIVKSVKTINKDDEVLVKVADGELTAKVTEIKLQADEEETDLE